MSGLFYPNRKGGESAEHNEPLDLPDELVPGEHGDLLADVGHGIMEGIVVMGVDNLRYVSPHLFTRSWED